MSLQGQIPPFNAATKGWKQVEVAILYSHLKEQGGAENVILKQVELLHSIGHNAKCYFSYVDKKFIKPASNPHCYIESYFQQPIPNSKTMRIILSIPLAPLPKKRGHTALPRLRTKPMDRLYPKKTKKNKIRKLHSFAPPFPLHEP